MSLYVERYNQCKCGKSSCRGESQIFGPFGTNTEARNSMKADTCNAPSNINDWACGECWSGYDIDHWYEYTISNATVEVIPKKPVVKDDITYSFLSGVMFGAGLMFTGLIIISWNCGLQLGYKNSD